MAGSGSLSPLSPLLASDRCERRATGTEAPFSARTLGTGGAARFDADMAGAEVRRARGRKVRSAGRILLASVLIGGGLIDGAGMSRTCWVAERGRAALASQPTRRRGSCEATPSCG